MSAHLLLLLPDGLIDRLTVQAAMEGVDPGDLVVEILAEELPGLLAHAARRYLNERISPVNEQSPVVLTHEALNGEEFSQAHAEPDHTARPAIKGASGGPAT